MADNTAALYSAPVLALRNGKTWFDGTSRRAPLADDEMVALLVNAAHGTMHYACKQPAWTLPLRDYDGKVCDDLGAGAHAIVVYRTLELPTAAVDIPPAEVAAAVQWLDELAAEVTVTDGEPPIAPVIDIWWRVRAAGAVAHVSARLGEVEAAADPAAGPDDLDAVDLPSLHPLRRRLASPEQLDGFASRLLVSATEPLVVAS